MWIIYLFMSITELYLDIKWDKGDAVCYLLQKLQLDSFEIIPIYIGDDKAGENAFDVTSSHRVKSIKPPQSLMLLAENRIFFFFLTKSSQVVSHNLFFCTLTLYQPKEYRSCSLVALFLLKNNT